MFCCSLSGLPGSVQRDSSVLHSERNRRRGRGISPHGECRCSDNQIGPSQSVLTVSSVAGCPGLHGTWREQAFLEVWWFPYQRPVRVDCGSLLHKSHVVSFNLTIRIIMVDLLSFCMHVRNATGPMHIHG